METNSVKPGFFESFNVKAAALNYIAVPALGLILMYVSYSLGQQKTQTDIDQLKDGQKQIQIQMQERSNSRTAEMIEMKTTLKTEVVTKEILELKLQPIRDELAKTNSTLDRIATAVNAPPAQYPQPR